MTASTLAPGIDRIALHPSTMMLDMRTLVEARGGRVDEVVGQMMIDQRSVDPPWEDPVTLAVNAGRRVLRDDERHRVKLLLVASESAPDQEKAMSTWVQRYLGLPDDCRNLEVKHACYGGSAAVRLALAWLAADGDEDDLALVICADQSRAHFGQPYEFVMGASGTAILLSRRARFLAIDRGLSGLYTHEVSDLIRPTSRVEAGHSETSLLSYIEAVDTAFARYADAARQRAGVGLDSLAAVRAWFPRQVYHAPFGGITKRAHRVVLRTLSDWAPASLEADYTERVAPSLAFNRRMGGTYAGSVFISLLGWASALGDAVGGERVGIYSYGSGSTGEFYSGVFGADAAAVAAAADVPALLDARLALTVAEYETAEGARLAAVDDGDLTVSLAGFRDHYARAYEGRGLLTFCGTRDHVRQYEWS